MSSHVMCRLSKAMFRSSTLLPVIEGNHYDLENIIPQALSDVSYDSFRHTGYLFKFPSTITAMIRKCKVLSGSRVFSCTVTRKIKRVEVSPHLDLSLVVHTDETSGAYEEDVTFQNFVKKSCTLEKSLLREVLTSRTWSLSLKTRVYAIHLIMVTLEPTSYLPCVMS